MLIIVVVLLVLIIRGPSGPRPRALGQPSPPEANIFVVDLQWHFPTECHIAVAFSKGLSLVQRMFTGIVQWIFSNIRQCYVICVISGVKYFAPILGLQGLDLLLQGLALVLHFALVGLANILCYFCCTCLV